jgi:gliding motility-associated-like protein
VPSQISLTGCDVPINNTTATVVVNPNPTFGILSATTPVCSGGNAVFSLSGTPNATVTYTINNSGANQTVVLNAAGNAPVTINNVTANTTILLSQISLASCTTSISNTTETVVVNPIPQVAITGDCAGSAYTLTANPVNGSFDPLAANYSWVDSSGNPIGGNTQSITVTQQGEYTVTVFSVGCPGSAMFSADDIACVIQKGISVNNDGKNDTLDLTGFNVKNLSIFNRYGEKVYTYQNYTNQWGGQSNNGDELPDGTYYYVINRDNGETRTGWVYINRAQ